MQKILFSFALIMIAATAASVAQDVEIVMNAPAKVASGVPFRLDVSVNRQNAKMETPKLDDFDVYGRSTSQNMSIINGDMTVKLVYMYTISAPKPGTYTIPAITATVNGQKYTSNSVTIEVTQGNSSAGSNPQSGSGSRSNIMDDSPAPSQGGNTFLEVNTNKSEVFVGEQVILSAVFYSRYDILGFDSPKYPNFNGFWAKDIYNPTNINFERKRINGTIYAYALWQKKALFPQKTGTLTIEPYSVECIVIDDFGFRRARSTAQSKSKTIKVKPLPAGKPDNFGGAVGNFTVSMSADKSSVKLDDPLTIKVVVSGTGNFQLFSTPKLDLPTEFEQYEPKSTENLTANDNGISGSKTFSTVVIARQPGEFTIKPVEFSFFDPVSKTYKTVKSKEITVSVSGERDPNNHTSAIVKTDVENLGSDIRFIKQSNVTFKDGNGQFFNSFKFWMIFALLIVIFGIVLIIRQQQIRNNANVIGMKNRRAGKTSRKRLKLAATYIKQNKKDEFYVETLNALWGYLSDKLAIPRADLSRDNVQEKLAEKQIDPAVTQKFIETLDTCEFEHYAPEAMSHSLDEVYTMAAEAIEQMETSIKA